MNREKAERILESLAPTAIHLGITQCNDYYQKDDLRETTWGVFLWSNKKGIPDIVEDDADDEIESLRPNPFDGRPFTSPELYDLLSRHSEITYNLYVVSGDVYINTLEFEKEHGRAQLTRESFLEYLKTGNKEALPPTCLRKTGGKRDS